MSSDIRHSVEKGMFVREAPRQGERPPLLFIHGLGESGLCFEHLLSGLGPGRWPHHLLIPDLPGYGRSPWPSGEPLGLVDQADLLARWLRERGTWPVVAVGHSMGGVVALLLAERHPELLAGLVDVDGNKSPGDCVFSSQAAGRPLPDFCARGFHVLQRAVHRQGRDDPAQRGYYVSMRLADPRAFHRNSRELVAMSEQRDMARRLAALPVPQLYVAGVPDGCCAESHRLLAEAGVPQVDISPSGHWPFIDQPEAFQEALRRFL